MSDQSRPLSRWSTSLSITTKSTAATNQTIPLINVRRKLFRQSGNHQKTFAQRMAKTKQDIEELFKLYYSNDIKFDTFQKQIVQGTKIPTTRSTAIVQNNLTDSSMNVFHSKHCVSREQISTTDIHSTEQQQQQQQQQVRHETTPIKSALSKRTVLSQVQNNSPIICPDSPSSPRISFQSVTKADSSQQDELCDSSLIKSVAFFGEISPDTSKNISSGKTKLNLNQRPKSSILNIQSIAPQTNIRKDPTLTSHTSFSTMTSVQTAKSNPPSVVTGSAVAVRPRSSSSKNSWAKQRTKSNLSIRNNSTSPQSPTKISTPALYSPLTVQPDMPEYPVFVGAQRVVSIPSRCSRYVLVTFPEAPLRYNTPTYVERLLLPERFPNLFQNIVHSYDHHLSHNSFQRQPK